MLQRLEDLLKTSTAEFKQVPSPTNGSGQAHVARNGGNGHRHRVRRQIHKGVRLAAAHAFVGAMLVREKGFTITDAADWSGSTTTYIVAMLTILDSRDEVLLDRVMTGLVGVLAAAAQVKGLSKLLKAYAAATADNKVAFGHTIGTENLFDAVIAPALAEAGVSMTAEAAE